MTRPLPLLLCLAALAPSCKSTGDGNDGWTVLFDGETLTGWTETGGRYDGDARWTVEDGVLTGRQGTERQGGLIYTVDTYDDFVFETEVKIDWPFDSGVFVRMLPRDTELRGAQVTLDWRPGGEIAGIYSDGWLQHFEGGAELFRRDEWNHVRVECWGDPMHLRVWVNGEEAPPFDLGEGAEGYAGTGRIGLQVHGGENVPLETKVQFRGVRVRPLDQDRDPDVRFGLGIGTTIRL